MTFNLVQSRSRTPPLGRHTAMKSVSVFVLNPIQNMCMSYLV